MDKLQKIILFLLLLTSAFAWLISKDQPDMMKTMMRLDPMAVSAFTFSWMVGMIAMMFPAIYPIVLLYNRLIRNDGHNIRPRIKGNEKENFTPTSFILDKDENDTKKRSSFITYSSKMILFVVCYIVVWALTGIILFLASSISMDTLIRMGYIKQFVIYGILLIISGAYQFSPLKTKCIGYCESPFSFFMRRWKNGKRGAIKMGIFHGLYCLGCCWPYFLLMVFLGWMNLLWMALFSSIIFVEKIWSRGLVAARIAGIGLMVLGFVAILFGPSALNLLGVGGVKEENSNSQSMDMKGMGDMANDKTQHISYMNQSYNHQHQYDFLM